MRESSTVARREVPPISKKLSSRPTRGRPRTSFQSRATIAAGSFRGGLPGCEDSARASSVFDAEEETSPLGPSGLSFLFGMHGEEECWILYLSCSGNRLIGDRDVFHVHERSERRDFGA